jgi:hypothetical protein
MKKIQMIKKKFYFVDDEASVERWQHEKMVRKSTRKACLLSTFHETMC